MGTWQVMSYRREKNHMVRQEWKKLLHNKILLVVILAVIAIQVFIPLCSWDLCGILPEIQISFLWRWSMKISRWNIRGPARTDESMKTLNQGLSALGEAAASLPEAARELEAGTEELRENAAALHNGMETLQQEQLSGSREQKSGIRSSDHYWREWQSVGRFVPGGSQSQPGAGRSLQQSSFYTDSLSEDDGWSISEEIQRTDPSYLYEEIQHGRRQRRYRQSDRSRLGGFGSGPDKIIRGCRKWRSRSSLQGSLQERQILLVRKD